MRIRRCHIYVLKEQTTSIYIIPSAQPASVYLCNRECADHAAMIVASTGLADVKLRTVEEAPDAKKTMMASSLRPADDSKVEGSTSIARIRSCACASVPAYSPEQ